MSGQGFAPRPALEPRSHKPQSRSQRHNPTVLDAVFIFFVSVTLLLLLFWIVAQVAGLNIFDKLPTWLNLAVSSVWGKVTLGSGTILSFALRKWLDKEPAPNYLLWIPGFMLFLLAAIVAVALIVGMIQRTQAQQRQGTIPSETSLKLEAPAADIGRVWSDQGKLHVRVIEQNPSPRDDGGLILSEVKPNSFTFEYPSTYPLPPQGNFVAYVSWVRAESLATSRKVIDYDFCLKPLFQNLSASLKVVLNCVAGACAPTAQGNFTDCRKVSFELPRLPVVFADTTAQKTTQWWVVPSLETLEQMSDRERVGYTRFEVQYQPSAAAKAGDLYYYSISVNDQPVYIDNLPPELLRRKLLPGSNQIRFGLENLNFSGRNDGKEKIALTVVILKAGKEILRQQIERDYIALRDPPPVLPMENAAGTFTWNGSYVKPKNENRFEVFVSSTRDPRLAMDAKTRYEALGLSYSGKGTVMVVRPPLHANPSYGLVLGLIQPTQQVQFTFAKEEAEAVCKWARDQANLAGTRRLLRQNVYLYDNYTNGYTPCH